MIPTIGFVGRSNSGKTTLIEKLLAEFARRGLRVAVVKHTMHRHVETDLPGKDSRRYWEAGAAQTVLVAGDRVVMTRRAENPSVDEALAAISDVDLIIVEGHKQADYPKIEVVRAARDPHRIPGLTRIIACVTDVPGLDCGDLPRFDFEAILPLADFIAEQLHLVR